MRKLLLFFTLLLIGLSSFAQSVEISGTVRDNDKQPLAGSAVYVKGSTSIATITDNDGKFNLKVPSETTPIVISFIGMVAQTLPASALHKATITLVAQNIQVGEVVVTAMGIKKERKALGYAVQDVKSGDIAKAQETNVTNALQGRVAGLTVSSSGGAAGASSAMIIRGITSIAGSNQPLLVVDGIPIDNSTPSDASFINIGSANTVTSVSSNRTSDGPNRASDLNPDDIESMTVLKGPAATALYGIDAASGAILITTKKGKSGKGKISYGDNFQFSSIRQLPTTQQMYDQGSYGRNTGQTLQHWGTPYLPNQTFYNNLDNFFQTGFGQTHNLSFEGGSDKTTFRVSTAYVSDGGVSPNNKYDRYNFKVSGNTKLRDNLSIDGSIAFIYSTNIQAPRGSQSPMLQALSFPTTVDMNNWQDPWLTQNTLMPNYVSKQGIIEIDNPYYVAYNNPVSTKTNRTISNFGVNYDPAKWLNIAGKFGADIYTTEFSRTLSPLTSAGSVDQGDLYQYTSVNSLLQSQLFATAKKNFGENFHSSLMLGNIVEMRENNTRSQAGEHFMMPELVSMNTTTTQRAAQSSSRRRLASAVGKFDIDYKSLVFFTATGRNDWSSTLPKANRSFFYPSISSSFAFGQLLREKYSFLNYGQFRISYAQTGKDAPPYSTGSAFNAQTYPFGGFAYGYYGGNPNLKPESTSAFETGLAMKFLNNRIGFDINYYNQTTKDQITTQRLSYLSGYILKVVNGGILNNQGIELQLTGTPIKTKSFEWNVTLNMAHNKGIMKEVPLGYDEYYISDTWVYGNVRGSYQKGKSVGNLSGFDYVYVDPNTGVTSLQSKDVNSSNGKLLIKSNGLPLVDQTHWISVGDRIPKLTGGIINDFHYKGFSLSVLFDYRLGGDVYNATEYYKYAQGLSDQTLKRNNEVIFNGYMESTDASGNTSYIPNTMQGELTQDFFTDSRYCAPAQFVEKNISWLRLKNLSLSYNFSKQIVERTPFSSMSVTFTANNLFMFTNYRGLDPDVNALNASSGGMGGIGIDYGSTPNPRVYSFGLKFTL